MQRMNVWAVCVASKVIHAWKSLQNLPLHTFRFHISRQQVRLQFSMGLQLNARTRHDCDLQPF